VCGLTGLLGLRNRVLQRDVDRLTRCETVRVGGDGVTNVAHHVAEQGVGLSGPLRGRVGEERPAADTREDLSTIVVHGYDRNTRITAEALVGGLGKCRAAVALEAGTVIGSTGRHRHDVPDAADTVEDRVVLDDLELRVGGVLGVGRRVTALGDQLVDRVGVPLVGTTYLAAEVDRKSLARVSLLNRWMTNTS